MATKEKELQELAQKHRFWVDPAGFLGGPSEAPQVLFIEPVALNPRFKSYFKVGFGDKKGVKFTQVVSANTAVDGIEPHYSQAVVVVVILRHEGENFLVLREGYRRCTGGWLADPVRGYALDKAPNNPEGEEVAKYLPPQEWGFGGRIPPEGIILSRAAHTELAEEILGKVRPSFMYYVDYFHENDYGHIGGNVIWLAGIECPPSQVVGYTPDDSELQGGKVHLVPIKDRARWRQLLRGHYGRLAVMDALELFELGGGWEGLKAQQHC